MFNVGQLGNGLSENGLSAEEFDILSYTMENEKVPGVDCGP